MWRLPADFPLQVAAQLLVVALPEELFFRGYIQGRLEEALPPTTNLFGARVGWAWILGAALFGLGHFLVTFEPQMLSRFFPGLAFGWMFARTRSILAEHDLSRRLQLAHGCLSASLSVVTPAAFFDMDRTLIRVNSGTLWIRWLRKRGEMSLYETVRGLGWIAQYKLSLLDMEAVAEKVDGRDARAARGRAGREGARVLRRAHRGGSGAEGAGGDRAPSPRRARRRDLVVVDAVRRRAAGAAPRHRARDAARA